MRLNRIWWESSFYRFGVDQRSLFYKLGGGLWSSFYRLGGVFGVWSSVFVL